MYILTCLSNKAAVWLHLANDCMLLLVQNILTNHIPLSLLIASNLFVPLNTIMAIINNVLIDHHLLGIKSKYISYNLFVVILIHALW